MTKKDTSFVKESGGNPWTWVLFMAWVGAAVYFYNLDPTFWGFFVALFKAAVWPAYVLYEVLGLLNVR